MVHVGEQQIGPFHYRHPPPRRADTAFLSVMDAGGFAVRDIGACRCAWLRTRCEQEAALALLGQLFPRRLPEGQAT